MIIDDNNFRIEVGKTWSYQKPNSTKIHTKSIGFSWSIWFLGWIVPVYRGGEAKIAWTLFGIMIAVSAFAGLVADVGDYELLKMTFFAYLAMYIYIGFNYNRWSYESKMAKGWVVDGPEPTAANPEPAWVPHDKAEVKAQPKAVTTPPEDIKQTKVEATTSEPAEKTEKIPTIDSSNESDWQYPISNQSEAEVLLRKRIRVARNRGADLLVESLESRLEQLLSPRKPQSLSKPTTEVNNLDGEG